MIPPIIVGFGFFFMLYMGVCAYRIKELIKSSHFEIFNSDVDPKKLRASLHQHQLDFSFMIDELFNEKAELFKSTDNYNKLKSLHLQRKYCFRFFILSIFILFSHGIFNFAQAIFNS